MKPGDEDRSGLTFLKMFAAVVLIMPFWGYAVIPLGARGILVSWVLALAAAAAFIAQFVLGRSYIRDAPGTLLIILVYIAIIVSAYQPLARNEPGMLSSWLTTFAQYTAGLGLVLVVMNSKATAPDVHRLLDLHIHLAAAIAAFGVVQLMGSGFGLDLNLSYLNPGMRDAISSYSERTGGWARATGLFEEPRQFGAYVAGALSLALGLLLFTQPTPIRRRRLVTLCVFLTAGLLSSLSASAMISAGMLLFVVMLLVPSHRTLLRRALPLLVLGSGIGVLFFFARYSDHAVAVFLQSKLSPPELGVMWAQIIHLDQGQFGWFRQLASVGVSLRTWALSPLVGVGLNNIDFYSVSLLPAEFTGSFGPLRLLAETGLFGVLSMSAFMGYLLLQLRSERAATKASGSEDILGLPEMGILIIASVLVRSIGTNLYGFTSMFFWAEAGLGIMVLAAVRHEFPRGAATPVSDRLSG